ncbi:3311_t:CDS:2 [Funneliformis geosporum]|uniref:15354_t:CDS:1 n=1 Tax=Funneliformis geosporum TaxID=1117311 RepID=A0A9W4SDN0_9GLOM|nr:15354_t:CDS:2 [Funneliformis geosporum]CAI2179322.1 3311_t:CDS:2 [Funneliformis geosporum]
MATIYGNETDSFIPWISINSSQNTQETTNTSLTSSDVEEIDKYRKYWWKTGKLHSKARWEEAKLPCEIVTDVSYDTYVEQTDKHNIRGWWEWEDGTVRVIEIPSIFHENCERAISREITEQTGGVKSTYADILNYGSSSTKSRGSGKDPDASFRPKAKPRVNRDGSDGRNQPWPNLVVEIAYSQSVADIKHKVEDYWLRTGRAHDVIMIKIEPPIAPTMIPVFMTAWHYCINNRTAAGALNPIMYDFSTTDDQGNPTNLQLGQRVINLRLACLYHNVPDNVLNPPPPQPNLVANLPNPITIDLYHVQLAILDCNI